MLLRMADATVNRPLDAIDRRLRWAGDHIEQMDRLIADLRLPTLYDIGVEPQPDGITYLYRVTGQRPIPDDLGLRIADCVHNLRAVLDNIAWALVSGYRQPAWGWAWPICPNVSRWRAKVLPSLEGVPQGAIDIIEALQPYHRSDGKDYWVHILNERWNRDKHQTPLIVGCIPERGSILESDGDVADYEIFVGRSLDVGVEVARVVYASKQHTRRQPRFAFEIAIEEGRSAMLRRIPAALQTAHYLISYEVLRPLRQYIEV